MTTVIDVRQQADTNYIEIINHPKTEILLHVVAINSHSHGDVRQRYIKLVSGT
jgi:hypothetical protein